MRLFKWNSTRFASGTVYVGASEEDLDGLSDNFTLMKVERRSRFLLIDEGKEDSGGRPPHKTPRSQWSYVLDLEEFFGRGFPP